MFATVFLATAIHEAGHFLAARHAGHAVLRAQIGGLEFNVSSAWPRCRPHHVAFSPQVTVLEADDVLHLRALLTSGPAV